MLGGYKANIRQPLKRGRPPKRGQRPWSQRDKFKTSTQSLAGSSKVVALCLLVLFSIRRLPQGILIWFCQYSTSSGPTTLNLYCNFWYYIPVYVPLPVRSALTGHFSETTRSVNTWFALKGLPLPALSEVSLDRKTLDLSKFPWSGLHMKTYHNSILQRKLEFGGEDHQLITAFPKLGTYISRA